MFNSRLGSNNLPVEWSSIPPGSILLSLGIRLYNIRFETKHPLTGSLIPIRISDAFANSYGQDTVSECFVFSVGVCHIKGVWPRGDTKENAPQKYVTYGFEL